jgi:hypothetical protein
MRTTLTILFLAAAPTAYAHPGHIAAQDGHAHYIAIGAAVVAGLVVAALIAASRLSGRSRADRNHRRRRAG